MGRTISRPNRGSTHCDKPRSAILPLCARALLVLFRGKRGTRTQQWWESFGRKWFLLGLGGR